MKNIIPEKLRKARQMRGLSMEGLSKKMDGLVSKQAISKYEKGLMQPAGHVLQALCAALGLPVEYFYTQSVNIGKIDFRIDSRIPVRSVSKMISMVEDRISRYLKIEEVLAISSLMDNPLKKMKISNEDDVEKTAERLRTKWDLGTTPIFSVFEMLESVGVKLLEFDIGTPHVIGFSTFVNKRIPLIVVNLPANHTTERKRFTALHELGHLLLNFTSDVNDSTKERLCNFFAGAVLCPASVLYRELGNFRTRLTLRELVSLKNRYGISIAAIVHRSKDLGIISDTYYNEIFDNHIHQNIMEEGWGGYPILENTDRFERLVQRAIVEELITIDELNEITRNQSQKYILDVNQF